MMRGRGRRERTNEKRRADETQRFSSTNQRLNDDDRHRDETVEATS
jgi:hypothetical protein